MGAPADVDLHPVPAVFLPGPDPRAEQQRQWEREYENLGVSKFVYVVFDDYVTLYLGASGGTQAYALLDPSGKALMLVWGKPTGDALPGFPPGFDRVFEIEIDTRFGDHGRLRLELPFAVADADRYVRNYNSFHISRNGDGSWLLMQIGAADSRSAIAIFKLAADGNLDPTFQRQGIRTEVAVRADSGIILDTKGRLYVDSTSSEWYGWNGSTTITRFLPDGTIDESFGAHGILIASGAPRPYGAVTWYHFFSEAADGNLLFEINTYSFRDRYLLSEDGRLLSSQSEGGSAAGRIQFSSEFNEALPQKAAAHSDESSTRNTAAMTQSDAEAIHTTFAEGAGQTLMHSAVGLIGVPGNPGTRISEITPAVARVNSSDASSQHVLHAANVKLHGHAAPNGGATRFALMSSDEFGLTIDRGWVDLSLDPLIDFCQDR